MINIPNLHSSHLSSEKKYVTTAKIIKIKDKFPWTRFFRKTKEYTLFVDIRIMPERVEFSGRGIGGGIHHRKPLDKAIFLDTQLIWENKEIGDTVPITICHYSVLQQDTHGVPALTFII